MSQYFKRMAARCRPSLRTRLPGNQQEGKHRTDIEVHEETLATPSFTTSKMTPTRPITQRKVSGQVVAPPEPSDQTNDPPGESARSSDQSEPIQLATEEPTENEMAEPLPKIVLPLETIEISDSVKVTAQPDIKIDNIQVQENTLTEVDHPEPEAKSSETERQTIKKLSESITTADFAKSELSEQLEQKTVIQSVEVLTQTQKTPIVKLADTGQPEDIQLAATQPLTPTLAKDEPPTNTAAKQQVNIKIGKIDLEVHQPQVAIKPAQVKSARRNNRQPARSNNLSRYYLRGGLD
jgi:hypothetical protein